MNAKPSSGYYFKITPGFHGMLFDSVWLNLMKNGSTVTVDYVLVSEGPFFERRLNKWKRRLLARNDLLTEAICP